MVAVNQLRTASSKPTIRSAKPQDPFPLIRGSFSSRRFSRQYPILAGLHKGVDGALVGVLVAVAFMSALTLHWQYLWTIAFTRLESTRDLSHRLMDSTAVLERHFLQGSDLSKSLVLTKTSNLIYLESPFLNGETKQSSYSKFADLRGGRYKPLIHGY